MLAKEHACIDLLLSQNMVRAKIRQSLSELLSSQKWKTSKMFSSSFGFNYFLSRYVAHSEKQKRSWILDMLKAKDKFFRTNISGEQVFGHLSFAKATSTLKFDFILYIKDGSTVRTEGTIFMFSCKLSILVHNAFTGYLLQFEAEPGTESEFIKERIVTACALRFFSATMVTCLRSDGKEVF